MDEKEELFRTEGLSRSFSSAAGEVHALRNVSLSIPAHGLTILNGKSGSGKTTLINLLGGLDRPTSGKAFFEGQELSALSERARDKIRRTRIGFVFQSVALISFMTALENVEFGLRVAGCPAAGRRERALECPRKCPAASSSGWQLPVPSPTGRGRSLPMSQQLSWIPPWGCR